METAVWVRCGTVDSWTGEVEEHWRAAEVTQGDTAGDGSGQITCHTCDGGDKTTVVVDRELVLQNSRVIIEYLDERFPHPPLLPVDPISRAKFRLALNEIEHNWYSKYAKAYNDEVLDEKFVMEIKNYFLEIAPLIKKKFFMSDDFGLVDCSIAPLLWRLKSLDFDLAENNKVIDDYSERLFEREAFQDSLTETEKELF